MTILQFNPVSHTAVILQRSYSQLRAVPAPECPLLGAEVTELGAAPLLQAQGWCTKPWGSSWGSNHWVLCSGERMPQEKQQRRWHCPLEQALSLAGTED